MYHTTREAEHERIVNWLPKFEPGARVRHVGYNWARNGVGRKGTVKFCYFNGDEKCSVKWDYERASSVGERFLERITDGTERK